MDQAGRGLNKGEGRAMAQGLAGWIIPGEYQEAIGSFKVAQKHHGEPLAAFEGWIGVSYDNLGLLNFAIAHYSKSIALESDAILRLYRGLAYLHLGDCRLATADAEVLLSMDPAVESGYHSDAEATFILAACSDSNGDYLIASQYMEESIAIAEAHQYSAKKMAHLLDWRDYLQGQLSTGTAED